MKFIDSHDQKISKDSKETSFDVRGNEVDDPNTKVFSKSVSIDLDDTKKQHKFFIRIFGGVPLDPFGPDAGREIWNRTSLRQVSKNTFESYNNYLSTKNRIYLTKANRSFIDG
jgi:hypothetical protein